ncbi:MAG: PH domain-containing protein [Candidatus Methanomethylophilus sp.]|jgi:putative membrane protein|nr:PH domain-containing protein [Methanomethylophilus sp.]MCI2075094.1 PH domain-containing protein [Methanomethylophilus sp.]MCI2092436.1 PH domain-containing protein [Methanomethylophilus sp.]
MEPKQYKNSRVVIAKNFIIFEIAITAILWGAENVVSDDADGGPIWTALLCILTALNAFSCWYIVEHTVFTFDGNKLTVNGKFVSRNKSEIQYSRMASVGITRSILDRLLGVSTLTFNVNSGVNSSSPDATLCIERGEAEKLRAYLNDAIFGMKQKDAPLGESGSDAPEPYALTQEESLVKVSNRDIIIHSFLSQSSPQLLAAIALVVWGAWSSVSESLGGAGIAFYLFVLEEVIPIISVCCRYYNYRIGRRGDTVVVECGMFTQKTVSFREDKVNSVRMRSPAFARALGLCTLEAEVVGTANGRDGDSVPLLCPMKKRKDVLELLPKVLPGFATQAGAVPQPEGGKHICILYWSIAAAVFAAAAGISWYLLGGGRYDVLALPAAAVLLLCAAGSAAYGVCAAGVRAFASDGNIFVFVTGGFDRSETRFNYDKVQYVDILAGPRERRSGVCRCSVSMLSARGFSTVTSGRFAEDMMRTVPDTVMARIRDGRYDWRRYS